MNAETVQDRDNTGSLKLSRAKWVTSVAAIDTSARRSGCGRDKGMWRSPRDDTRAGEMRVGAEPESMRALNGWFLLMASAISNSAISGSKIAEETFVGGEGDGILDLDG